MLQVKRITLIRGERLILAELSFSVNPGQLVEVIGVNGSGKSSLLRALCGLLVPESGDIYWCGKPIAQQFSSYKNELCYIGHAQALHPSLTVLENLKFLAMLNSVTIAKSSAEAKKLAGAENFADASSILAKLNLSKVMELPIAKLSAGQQQRLSLVRLLLTKRKLWLLDEPFANLDAAAVNLLMELIRQHIAEQGLVVVAAHQRSCYGNIDVHTIAC